MQDTISQLKSLQDVLQTSQKEVQEKGKKVEELDKMLNESMEELQQKDKNLKEKESKVVELDKALKERQWELKQKAAQVRNYNDSYLRFDCFGKSRCFIPKFLRILFFLSSYQYLLSRKLSKACESSSEKCNFHLENTAIYALLLIE